MRGRARTRWLQISVLVVSALGLIGCAARVQSQAVPARWVVIGESSGGPSSDTLAGLLPTLTGGDIRPQILDLSTVGADLLAVIQSQLAPALQSDPDLIVVRLGTADLADRSALGDGRFATLLRALLHTLTGSRATVIVSTIDALPDTFASDAAARLAQARTLRRAEQVNRLIRAAVAEFRVTLAERERRSDIPASDLAVWRAAVETALGLRGPSATSLPDARAVLIRMEGPSIAHYQEVLTRGAAAGLRADVLAKVGDSITSAPEFLAPLVPTDASDHSSDAPYADTLAFFNQTPLDRDGRSSFARRSRAARPGWRVAHALAGDTNGPLAREVAEIRPAIAMVMFGTNDLTQDTVESFEQDMDRLLRWLVAEGIVPVLSTIPDRADDARFARQVPEFNAAIRALATVYAVPLIDYGAAMASLPSRGLNPDGIHPSVCPEGAGVFTPTCLQYGYNLRNMLTIQALDLLRTRVLLGGELAVGNRPMDANRPTLP